MDTVSNTILWVRVGDTGEYESFDSLDDAIEYLNELQVGKITHSRHHGFDTPNYHGQDYISIYWGGPDASAWTPLEGWEYNELAARLEPNFI